MPGSPFCSLDASIWQLFGGDDTATQKAGHCSQPLRPLKRHPCRPRIDPLPYRLISSRLGLKRLRRLLVSLLPRPPSLALLIQLPFCQALPCHAIFYHDHIPYTIIFQRAKTSKLGYRRFGRICALILLLVLIVVLLCNQARNQKRKVKAKLLDFSFSAFNSSDLHMQFIRSFSLSVTFPCTKHLYLTLLLTKDAALGRNTQTLSSANGQLQLSTSAVKWSNGLPVSHPSIGTPLC